MTVPLLFDDAEARERWRLGSSPLGRPRVAAREVVVPADVWRPMETLTTPGVEVELLVREFGARDVPLGWSVRGWLATHFRCAPRTFWARVGDDIRCVEPTAWRPLPSDADAQTPQERLAA